jgi:ubiquinone/menaquinone biosynthesis C-methylase UbiE
MDPRLQRRVQRYGWDKAAGCYEEYWARQLAPAQERLLALAALRPGERVLDVASGTGLVTLQAARLVGPSGFVIGTDISQAMVDRLRDEVRRLGLSHVTVERFDAEELGVGTDSCDVALCALGLMYVTDPVAALREMHRVVRAGGRVVTAVWGARARCGWAEVFPIVESRVASEVCPLFFQLGTGEGLRYALDAAGWGDIAVERLATTLVYDSAEAACGAAFAGGPVALAYSRFDEATRASAEADYLSSISAFQQGETFRIPGEFVIAKATRGPG